MSRADDLTRRGVLGMRQAASSSLRAAAALEPAAAPASHAPHDPGRLEARAQQLLAAVATPVSRQALEVAAPTVLPHLTALGREQVIAHALVLVGLAGLPKVVATTRPVEEEEPTTFVDLLRQLSDAPPGVHPAKLRKRKRPHVVAGCPICARLQPLLIASPQASARVLCEQLGDGDQTRDFHEAHVSALRRQLGIVARRGGDRRSQRAVAATAATNDLLNRVLERECEMAERAS